MHAMASNTAVLVVHSRTQLDTCNALEQHLCALAQLDVLWLADQISDLLHCLKQCMPWLATLPLWQCTTALSLAQALHRLIIGVLWLS